MLLEGYYYGNQEEGYEGYQDVEEEIVIPRTIPIPVRWEVANYSKKEGVELQTGLLNAQDRCELCLCERRGICSAVLVVPAAQVAERVGADSALYNGPEDQVPREARGDVSEGHAESGDAAGRLCR